MQYAEDSGRRIEAAATGQRAKCPGCGGEVMSKCGEIVIWHWAHVSGNECDSWWEPESAWHRSWKEKTHPACREVVIENHRADIATDSCIVELQHGSLASPEIREREDFYSQFGKLVWLFDAAPFIDNVIMSGAAGRCDFHWMWPRKSMGAVRIGELFWDINGRLFHVRHLHTGQNAGGWGVFVDLEVFLTRYLTPHSLLWAPQKKSRTPGVGE